MDESCQQVVYGSIRGLLNYCTEDWEGHNFVLGMKFLNYMLIIPYQAYYQFIIVSCCVIENCPYFYVNFTYLYVLLS